MKNENWIIKVKKCEKIYYFLISNNQRHHFFDFKSIKIINLNKRFSKNALFQRYSELNKIKIKNEDNYFPYNSIIRWKKNYLLLKIKLMTMEIWLFKGILI